MFECQRCKQRFSEYEAESRPARLGDSLPPWARVTVCPFCGSDDNEEVYEEDEEDV